MLRTKVNMTSSARALVAVTFALAAIVTLTSAASCRGSEYPDPPQEWRWQDFPNPNSVVAEQQFQCCRSNQSSICDPNHLIPDATADQIDLAINSIYSDTRCGCSHCALHGHGYLVRVAVMEKMVPVYNDTYDTSAAARLRDAQRYAYQLTRPERWDLGGRCQEGLIILYSRQDNILFTLTLREARRRLDDAAVERISMQVMSMFQNPDTVGDGLLELLRMYRIKLGQQRAITPQ